MWTSFDCERSCLGAAPVWFLGTLEHISLGMHKTFLENHPASERMASRWLEEIVLRWIERRKKRKSGECWKNVSRGVHELLAVTHEGSWWWSGVHCPWSQWQKESGGHLSTSMVLQHLRRFAALLDHEGMSKAARLCESDCSWQSRDALYLQVSYIHSRTNDSIWKTAGLFPLRFGHFEGIKNKALCSHHVAISDKGSVRIKILPSLP